MNSPAPIILWTGPRHSGKTTAALGLIERAEAEGFTAAGVAAPAVHEGGVLAGFDVIDLHTSERRRFAQTGGGGGVRVGRFRLTEEGPALGSRALSRPEAFAGDLVLIDEFGPLELRGGGWRAHAEALAASARGVIVPVVREGLADAVEAVFAGAAVRRVHAGDAGAAEDVLALLRARRGAGG